MKYRVTQYDKVSVFNKHGRLVWRWKIGFVFETKSFNNAKAEFIWANSMVDSKAVLRMVKEG